MYYFIYETTNHKNGKKYRGRHQTDDLNDGYLGSGTYLKKAIEKYGKDSFSKEIIFHATDYDDLLWAERVFADKDWVERKDTYNITEGGGGSYTKWVDGKWVNVMQIDSVKKKRHNTLQSNGYKPTNLFSTTDNPMNSKEVIDKMVATRKRHPLGYHQGRTPFNNDLEQSREKTRIRMTNHNPMQNEQVKQNKRDKFARKYGFSDDQQFTNYINDLYYTMAMTPGMIREVIGCDKSTVERRCVWVPCQRLD